MLLAPLATDAFVYWRRIREHAASSASRRRSTAGRPAPVLRERAECRSGAPRSSPRCERAGRVVAETLAEVRRTLVPGMTTAERRRASARRCSPATARARGRARAYGFPGCLCLSVDDEAVHGIPGERVLRAGRAAEGRRHGRARRLLRRRLRDDGGRALDPAAARLRAAADAALRRGSRGRPGRHAAARGRRGGGAAGRGARLLRPARPDGPRHRPRLHEPPTVPSWDAPWARRPPDRGPRDDDRADHRRRGARGGAGRRRLDDPDRATARAPPTRSTRSW